MSLNDTLDQIYLADPNPMGFQSSYEQLRPAERRFVDAYVSDIASSALKAGKRVADYLKIARPSGVIAHEFLSRPLIRAAITDRCNSISREAEISTIRVLQEVKSLAYSSMKHYIVTGDNGSWDFDLSKLSDEQWAAVKSIKIGQNQWGPTKALELHAKQPALDMLTRFLGLDQTGVPDPKIIDINPNVRENSQLYATTLEDDE